MGSSKYQDSLFDRLIGTHRSMWWSLGVIILLLTFLLIAVKLDGNWEEVFLDGRWRVLILAPIIIAYIFFITPILTRMGENAIEELRPIIKLSDEEFALFVMDESRINPKGEMGSFVGGFLLGLIITVPELNVAGFTWVGLYWIITTAFMYGILAWTIYASVASTRLVSSLLRQEMDFDILAPTPFEAIGRQSLVLAVAFVGGITISLLLSFKPESLLSPFFWLGNLAFIFVAVLIFFLNMRPTHQVLAAEKKNQLVPIQILIVRSCREMVDLLDRDSSTGSIPDEIIALEHYEKRLQQARTWPYDTRMLRTLFFSVLIPLGTLVARVVFDIMFQ